MAETDFNERDVVQLEKQLSKVEGMFEAATKQTNTRAQVQGLYLVFETVRKVRSESQKYLTNMREHFSAKQLARLQVVYQTASDHFYPVARTFADATAIHLDLQAP